MAGEFDEMCIKLPKATIMFKALGPPHQMRSELERLLWVSVKERFRVMLKLDSGELNATNPAGQVFDEIYKLLPRIY